jgi:hypothetical protein
MYTLHQQVAQRLVVRWRQGYASDGRFGGIQSTSLPLPPALRQVLNRSNIAQEQVSACSEVLAAVVVETLQSKLAPKQAEMLRNTERTDITAVNYPGLTRLQLAAEGFKHRPARGVADYFMPSTSP